MTHEEQTAIISEMEKDITYFSNIGFEQLASKLRRYLELVKSLVNTN